MDASYMDCFDYSSHSNCGGTHHLQQKPEAELQVINQQPLNQLLY